MQNVKNEPHAKQFLRIQRAYLLAREEQDRIEVELNRARIIMVDQNGKFIKELNNIEH